MEWKPAELESHFKDTNKLKATIIYQRHTLLVGQCAAFCCLAEAVNHPTVINYRNTVLCRLLEIRLFSQLSGVML